MFRISDFSRLTRVTVQTLRHYDRLGLLAPAFVDPDSRFRYYAARQVPRLYRIRALRDLGFSLEHIAHILEEEADESALRRLLERRRQEIGKEMEEGVRRLAQIEASITELGRGCPVPVEASVRDLAPMRVATLREKVADLDQGAETLFEAVEAHATQAGARAAGPPILIYHDRDFREIDADIEAAVPITAQALMAGRATIRTLPGHRAACATYSGRYEKWSGVTQSLLTWLEARCLTPAGPVREVYLQFAAGEPVRHRLPAQYLVGRPDDLLTEVQIPVEAGPAAAKMNNHTRR